MRKAFIRIISAVIPSKAGRKRFRSRYQERKPEPTPESLLDPCADYRFEGLSQLQTIIDCGSNVGESVRHFYDHCPNATIIAYEADRSIFEAQLVPALTIDGQIPDRVRLENKAVWVHADGIQFFEHGGNAGSCVQSTLKDQVVSPVSIPSVRLKDVLLEHDRIDLLKIDIEGVEVDVVLDCADVLDRVDRIFVEFHSFVNKPQRLSELLHVLESNGFKYRLNEDFNPYQAYWHYTDNGNTMDCQLKIFALGRRVIEAAQ